MTGALGYRVLVDERVLTSQRKRLVSIDASIEDGLRTLSDVRGSMHAYVAPGQRSTVWEARSAALLDKLRQQLIALDAAADSSGRSLNDSLDNLDQLTAADKRVQHYLDFSQPLLAGDVIFTEIRDLIDATAQQMSSVRDALRQDANFQIDEARREQASLLLGGTLFWLGLGFLLALLPASPRTQAASSSAAPPAVAAESFDLSLTPRQAETGNPQGLPPQVPELGATASVEAKPIEDPKGIRWKTVSRICAELASVKEFDALSGSLSRACEALGARDAIVWVASADGATLTPRASHGFEPRVLTRIGSIARDSANLTAAAFRDGQPHHSAATTTAPGAIAIAVRGPSGPVGVLSAELQPQQDVGEAIDIATIFAAQIAPLVLQTAPVASTEEPQRRQA
ncbi:MAG: GAF domain-containing protein [Vicinamibacterales bacterium]